MHRVKVKHLSTHRLVLGFLLSCAVLLFSTLAYSNQPDRAGVLVKYIPIVSHAAHIGDRIKNVHSYPVYLIDMDGVVDKAEAIVRMITIAGMFCLLLAVHIFQGWLFSGMIMQRKKIFRFLSISFLFFTLVCISYYHIGQLSIVNMLGFIGMLTGGFKWGTLAAEPIIFLKWSVIAISLPLLGLGVFCGRLCLYSAMAKLMYKIPEKFKVSRLEFPPMVYERFARPFHSSKANCQTNAVNPNSNIINKEFVTPNDKSRDSLDLNLIEMKAITIRPVNKEK